MPTPPQSDASRTLARMLTGAIVLIAIAGAGAMLAEHWHHPDSLYRGPLHDRHGYLDYGMNLAIDIRNVNPLHFLFDLEAARYWGPLHGLVMAVALALGGLDYRLGLVPAGLGWAITLVLCWLIPRRMFTERIAGMFAGAVAVSFMAASPLFRLLSSDVMVESLGAALTGLAIWLYMLARSEPSGPWRWRAFALSLTALFFCKGNYWGLAVAGLLVAFLVDDARGLIEHARQATGAIRLPALLRSVATDPSFIIVAVLAVLIATICARGPTAVELFGRSISLYPPGNLTTLAYAVLFIRLAFLWHRHRPAIDEFLGVPGRAMLYWHVAPVAIQFLIPKRLPTFLFYVGPANTPPQLSTFNPWGGLLRYWSALGEWHPTWSLALLAVGLAVVALLQARRFAPSQRTVFFVMLVAAAAVTLHPQHQPRYMGSWIFTLWISAGVGAGVLLSWIGSYFGQTLQAAIAVIAVAGLGFALALPPIPAAAYASAFRAQSGGSDLELAAAYLPFTAGDGEVGFAATFGKSWLFYWTLRQQCRCRRPVSFPRLSPLASRETIRQETAEWIAGLRASRIVLIDATAAEAAHAPYPEWPRDQMAGILDAFAAQDKFTLIATRSVPSRHATVSIWQRR